MLCERLQLLPADRADIDIAGRLVDLGKAAVRVSILQKEDQLTELEAQSLQNHPVRAAEQLECVPGLRRVAQILRHQSERYDGKGSPDGLRGDRIPIGSRILAIASSFDLLITCADERPLDWEAALAQLGFARGDVFDPWLLELFEEEVRRNPPTTATDRPVMIVPAGSMPWRSPGLAEYQVEDESAFDEDDLEVMLEERRHEEGA
jgi:response regulator RpfG family c-di-GMP phosphodiesterase